MDNKDNKVIIIAEEGCYIEEPSFVDFLETIDGEETVEKTCSLCGQTLYVRSTIEELEDYVCADCAYMAIEKLLSEQKGEFKLQQELKNTED